MTFIGLLFSTLIFSQEIKKEKIYEFDYFLEYSSTGGECFQDTCKYYVLVNSKDNNYSLTFSTYGKDSLYVYFNDYYKAYARGRLLKTDLLKQDTLDFKCGYNKHIRDNFVTKLRKEKNEFTLNYHKIEDTIVNGKNAVKYAIINEKKLKRKRKKGKNIKLNKFILIEKNKAFRKTHLNNYFNLEQWKKSNTNFDGLIIYSFRSMKNSNLKDWKQKLKNYTKFSKVVKLTLNCD